MLVRPAQPICPIIHGGAFASSGIDEVDHRVGVVVSCLSVMTLGRVSAGGRERFGDRGFRPRRASWAVAVGSGHVLWSKDISSYTGISGDLSRTSPAVYGGELILGDGWILSPSTVAPRCSPST